MTRYALIIIGLLATFGTIASLAKKPIEPPMQIDAQSPGVWPKYASAQVVMPGVMVCQPLLYPRHAPPSQIVRT